MNSTWVETIWKCVRAKFALAENNPVYHITLEVYKKSVCNAFSMAVYRNIINWKGSTVLTRSTIMDLLLFYSKESEELEFNFVKLKICMIVLFSLMMEVLLIFLHKFAVWLSKM